MHESESKPSLISILAGGSILLGGIVAGGFILAPLFTNNTANLPSGTDGEQSSQFSQSPVQLPDAEDYLLIVSDDAEIGDSLIASINRSLQEYNLPTALAVSGTLPDNIRAAMRLTASSSDDHYELFFSDLSETAAILPLEGGLVPWQAATPGNIPIIITSHEVDFASDMAVALFLISKGEPEKAIAILESTAGTIPAVSPDGESSNRAVHAFIGALAAAEMDHQIDALKAYSQAIRHRPDFTNAYINRGSVYLETGDETTAISTFLRDDTAGGIDKGYLAYNLALAHIEADDLESAVSYAEEVHQSLGDVPLTVSLSGLLAYLNEDYETAIREYTSLATSLPGDPTILTNLGISQNAFGQHEQALDTFLSLVERRGISSDYIHLAETYRELGINEGAIDAYDHAISITPDESDLLVARGRLHLENGNTVSSRADAEAALVINPEDGNATFLIGDILLQDEAWNDARNAYIEAERLGVDEASLFAHRGWVSHMLRMTEAASTDYQEALERGYSEPLLLYWLGIALFDSGYSADSLDILFAAVNAIDNAEVNAALALSLDTNVRRAEAEQAFQRAIDMDERFSDPEYLRTLPLWNDLSVIRAQNILRRLGYME